MVLVLTMFQIEMLRHIKQGSVGSEFAINLGAVFGLSRTKALIQMRGIPRVSRKQSGFGINKRLTYSIDTEGR